MLVNHEAEDFKGLLTVLENALDLSGQMKCTLQDSVPKKLTRSKNRICKNRKRQGDRSQPE